LNLAQQVQYDRYRKAFLNPKHNLTETLERFWPTCELLG